MTTRLHQSWQSLRESLWFVPGLMLLGSFGLAYGLIEFDRSTSFDGAKRFPLLFGNGAEGARGMLSAIAGSMLTVATLAFSLTLSAITQVSSQYSPRVLRNFMNDRLNQLVMGYFVGVFAFCLIVLGTIRSTDEGKFVPASAVLAGLVLALGGVVALIFFIHHIAESLQTGTIVERIFRETRGAIDQLFPQSIGQPTPDPDQNDRARRIADSSSGWLVVRADQTGYLQRLDEDGLLDWATKQRVILRTEQRPGTFIHEGMHLFSLRNDIAHPHSTATTDRADDLLAFITIGRHRSVEQDATFGIQQLVDIVLKALSPGINDTTTAIMAIDYLGAVMHQLAQRDFPSPYRFDQEQQLRVIAVANDFDHYLCHAFDLPRINAKGNHAVLGRLLQAMAVTGRATRADRQKLSLQRQAALLLAYAEQTLATADEKAQVRSLYHGLEAAWQPEGEGNTLSNF